MEGKRIFLVVVLGLVLALSLYSATTSVEPMVRYPDLSCSPENEGLGGTSRLFDDLSQKYNVIIINNITQISRKSLYIIIGPDKPITPREARIISNLVKTGHINLLIADETDNTDTLLEQLGLPELDGPVINETADSPDWRYIVHMKCGEWTVPASKAVRLEQGVDNVLCYYEDGSSAAALYSVGKGTVLVVGDSSIFANFLYEGYLGMPPTKPVVSWLIEQAAGEYTTIMIDNVHYTYNSIEKPRYVTIPSGILLTITKSLQELSGKVENAPWYWLLIAIVAATLPWPAILLHPVPHEKPWEDPLRKLERILLELEASRLGLAAEAGPEDIIKEAEGG